MPPAKSRLVHEDSRSEASSIRERQIAAAAHARNSKNVAALAKRGNGSSWKELAVVSAQAGEAAAPGAGQGVRLLRLPYDGELDNYADI